VVHGTSHDAALARLDGLIALGISDKKLPWLVDSNRGSDVTRGCAQLDTGPGSQSAPKKSG